MFKFLFLYRSPEGDDNGGGAGAGDTADTQDAIEAALRGDDAAGEDKGGSDDKAGAGADAGAAGGASDDKGGAADDKGTDDPEHELGLEDGDKKPIKVKLSELLKNSRWIKENEKALAGFVKLREEGAKNPDFNKLMRAVISKSYNADGQYNEAFVKTQLTQIEKVADKVDDKIEAKDEDIDATKAMLDELDADSPQAKVLAHNLKIMKAQKAQLVAQAGQLDALTKRLDGIDKTVKTGQEQAAKEKDDAEVKRIADVFDQTFETLLSTKTNGYEFEDADEKAQFEDLVRNGVAARSKSIKTDVDFQKVIAEEAKTAMGKINGIREKYTNRYLRSKGKLPAKGADASKEKNKDTKPDLGNLDTEGITDMFTAALKEETGSKK